jgi:hypothetical protein
MSKTKSVFETLSSINVNDKVEKKNGLTYLSWAWAWSEVQKHYPDATYKIKKTLTSDGVEYPYVSTALGLMCETEVTIEGNTKSMWLPVMDGANKAMKEQPYSYKTRYGDKSVAAATMFDVNKTLMRCLVKNLAMFGLGIYIYAGEDLPESEESLSSSTAPTPTAPVRKEIKAGTKLFNTAIDKIKQGEGTVEQLIEKFQISKSDYNLLVKATS